VFGDPTAWLPDTVNLKSNRIALLVPLVIILVVLGILALVGNSITR
jgi:hypothetical protein